MALLKALREDLPGGMWDVIDEQYQEIKRMLSEGEEVDWNHERELLDERCKEYGLPSVFV